MSLLDTASLIVTPNGYKEGKLYSVIPSDGSGDMSVVRATTATRVNSAGLVELVPYNLLNYSQNFTNGVWPQNASPTITTDNLTAPNGTLTADTFSTSAYASGVYQTANVAIGSTYTFSVYIKNISGATAIIIGCDFAPANGNVIYNAVTNTITTTGGGVISTSVENAGNGWFRVSGTYVATGATNSYIVYAGTSSAMQFGVWGSQLNEGTLKDYQKTETRLNIPRLDYSNGTCPSLLVEPQRTNLVYPSSDFSTIWSLLNSATVSTNQSIAPDGTLTADKITTTNSANALFNVNGSGTTAADYTVSLFIKPINNNSVGLGMTNDTTGEAFVLINLQTGAGTTTQQSGWSNASYKWEQYENGWYRISLTATKGASGNARFILKGNASSEYYLWGAQLEAGSYATSYIPTTSASVTRNADVISKTGISSLIGQTEGTLYFEAKFVNVDSFSSYIGVTSGTFTNSVIIGKEAGISPNKLFLFIRANGSDVLFNTSIALSSDYVRCAIAYKSGNWAAYVNGTLVASGTSSFSFSSSLDRLGIGTNNGGLTTVNDKSEMKAAALWKTRLTNDQLATLTTL